MTFVAFCLGAIVGSFLNVCIFRLPEGESIVVPGSHCRSCRKPIAWYDNVPILSYFILRARCRHCGTALSAQYVCVEALSGLIFVLFYAYFGLGPAGWTYLIFTLAMVVVTGIDFRHQIIPDAITLPGILIALGVSAWFPALHGQTLWWKGLLWSAVGVLAGGGVLYIAGTVAEWILKKEAMGGGDVKLLAMIGALTGWQGVVWTLFVSSVLGSVVGLYLRFTRGDERIPFGPYLAAAAVLYFFFGPRAIEWYLTSIGRV